MKETKKYRAIIGIYFGSLTPQYFIIKNNDIKNNITGSCPSELILDEENEEGKFYGNDAHKNIQNIIKKKYLFFSNFKKYLDSKENLEDKKIKSDFPKNHKIYLKTVIKEFFKLFKDDILNKQLKNKINDIDIKWVLTTPGLWDENGKEFIRKIAKEIGLINSEIIIEQEAASLAIFRDENIDKSDLQKDSTYLLVDLGHTSVEICANKIIDKKYNLRQLLNPKSLRIGSNFLNDKIIEIIEDVCDKELIEKCQNMNYSNWKKTLDDIENKKKKLMKVLMKLLKY